MKLMIVLIILGFPFNNINTTALFIFCLIDIKRLIFIIYGECNWINWEESYKKNIIYTPLSFLLENKEKFTIKKIIKLYIILNIHKIILIIQIISFTIFFITNYTPQKKNNNFNKLFIQIPHIKSKKIKKILKNRKFPFISKYEIKLLIENIIFIKLIGWSKWSINNCIIILKIIENSTNNKIYNIPIIIKYCINRINKK